VRVLTAPCFLATKLEAFHGRGRNDFYSSHDLEDAITVIDGRAEIIAEVLSSPDEVRNFISSSLGELLRTATFLEALPGYLLPDIASQSRLTQLRHRLRQLVMDVNGDA